MRKVKRRKVSLLQCPTIEFDFKCKYGKSRRTHFTHAAVVPKEEEVPAAQVHGQNRAESLSEAAHVPTEP